MRKLFSFVFAVVIYACAILAVNAGIAQSAHAATPAEISGDWATPGLGAVVRLAPCTENAALLCGRLIWAWDPARLRSGAVGAAMLRDFGWDGAAFAGGVLVSPEDGRAYSGTIRLDGAVLRLRGCAGPFCQSQVWRRLGDIPRP